MSRSIGYGTVGGILPSTISNEKDIDWGKSPEGFDYYLVDHDYPDEGHYSGFHQKVSGKFFDIEGGNYDTSDESFTVWQNPYLPSQIISDNNIDALETQSHPIAPSVEENVTESVTDDFPANVSGLESKFVVLPSDGIGKCPIEQIKQLCSDHNVNIEITCKGEIYVHAEDDYTYKINDENDLTRLLDSVKLLASFREE